MKNKKSVRGKIGVAKGYGPMHAENAKEGEPVDLTKIDTDTVPAMLTPREAVLNKNAAELAGRPNIEALNAEGNQLARKGVDLAAGGMSDVKEKIMKSKPKQAKAQSGSPYVQAFQKLMPPAMQGGGQPQPQPAPVPPGYEQGVSGVPSPMPPYSTSGGGRPMPGQMPPGGVRPGVRPGGGMPDPMSRGGGFNMANINQAAAGLPVAMGGSMQPPAPIGGPYGGTLGDPRGYPVGIGHGYAGGSSEVAQGPIGTPPQGEQAYGPPVNLTAPQLQRMAQQAGLSQGQLAGLMKAFQGGQQAYNSIGQGGFDTASPAQSQAIGDAFGFGGAGYQGGSDDVATQRQIAMRNPYGNSDLMRPPDIEDLATVPSSLGEAERRRLLQEYLLSIPTYPPNAKGYQGGISDIGYPPFVAPSANYDGNRGGWLGPYDPSFMIQRY